jgi:hypothetical protein
MSNSGFLSALPLIGGLGATLATGGLGAPLLGLGEAAGVGAGEAAAAGAGGLAGAAGLPTAEALLAAPATAGLGSAVSTPLSAGALAGFSDAAISGLPDAVSGLGSAAGAGSNALSAGVPAATQALGQAGPFSDFTGGALGAGNEFGLPAGSEVAGPVQMGAPAAGGGGASSAYDESKISEFLGGETDVFHEDPKSFWSKAGDFVSSPEGRLGLAGGGLLASGLMGQGPIPGSAPLNASANTATTNASNLMAQANQNLGALNTGALPAGAQSAIHQAANSAKANIRSQYAQMGLGHSSSEAQALAAVDQQAATQRLAQAEKLTNLGLKEAGLSGGQQALASEEYLQLMNAKLRQDDRLANALARFSGALAGGAVGQGSQG